MYPLRPVLFRIGDWWGNKRFGMVAKILAMAVLVVFLVFLFGWAFCKISRIIIQEVMKKW